MTVTTGAGGGGGRLGVPGRALAMGRGGRQGDPSAKGKRRKASPKRGQAKKPGAPELAAELSVELANVRSLLKESSENLMTRLDGQLVGLMQYLNGKGVAEEKPLLPPPGALSEMIARAKAIKVKPHKGRVKDLGRIEDLLDCLAAGMPPGE